MKIPINFFSMFETIPKNFHRKARQTMSIFEHIESNSIKTSIAKIV